MADVLIVCVREDEPLAKAFADMFERAGLQVGGAPSAPEDMRSCGAALVVWSQASIRSRAFLDAAQRAVNAGKAVVACLIAPPPAASINHAPAFDLTHWAGDPDDPSLDPLFFAVDRMVNSARTSGESEAYEMAAAAPEQHYAQAQQQDYPAPPYARARQAPPPPAPAPRAAPVTRLPPPAPRMAAPRQPSYDAPPPRAPAPQRHAAPAWRDSDPMAAEAQNWAAIRHSRNPEDFLKHLADFGAEGAFAELAQMKLAELEAESRRHRQTPAAAARQDAMRAEPVRLDPTRGPPQRMPPQRAAPQQPQPQMQQRPAPMPRPRPMPQHMEGLEPTRMPPQRMPPQRAAPSFEPVRSEPPPRPRPEPLMWRDEPRAPPPRPDLPARASGGGAGRMIILFLVLGGAALGAGIFAGDRLSVASLFSGGAEQAAAESDDGWSDGPARGETGAATASVNEASSRRLASGELPDRRTRPDERRPAQLADRGRSSPTVEDDEGPTPSPRFGPDRPRQQPQPQPPQQRRPATTTTTTTTAVTGDLSPDDPGTTPSTSFGPVQLASNTPPPSAAPSASPVAARPPQVIWSQRPSAQRISELFPDRALRSNQIGRVELDCLIDTRGTPRCAVAQESPPGYGFGAAAVRASGQFRASPALDDGAPSAGAHTRLVIVFRTP